MRRSQLRDYLLGLVLAALPLTAACDTADDLVIDGGIDLPLCNPDFPKHASQSYPVPSTDGGALDCVQVCTNELTSANITFRASELTCEVTTPSDADAGTTGSIACNYLAPSGCGRAPDGLAPPAFGAASDEQAAYWARAAHLEAASVEAFERLAEELLAHDAPEGLVARARAAALDERRHAEVTAALARRHGASVPPVELPPFEVRPLFQVARENAVEGQVTETYGAVVAVYQAQHARAPEVAAAMSEIADDELAHAELSWALGRWFETRLSDEERASLKRARQGAAEALARTQSLGAHSAASVALGLPDAATRTKLLDALARDLWT